MPAEQTRPPSPPKIKRTPKAPRQELPVLDPERRRSTPDEVALGFDLAQAQAEALRCLNCKDPKCQDACPIHTDIKGFIDRMVQGDYTGAYDVLQQTNPFPGICGRVCQHELFCEKDCLLGVKLASVAIGSLERFVADYHRLRGEADPLPEIKPNGLKVGMVGSGPASLMCANDLARLGYKITVFEALHELGGVLAYGIPPFRLPREIIAEEVNRLRKLGVEFRTDFIVGKTATLDELFGQGYAAVFLGTGAGLPWMLGVPGENLIGVYTANEFLTRINLMHAYDDSSDTPVHVGKHTVVIGGGNSAMDAARWAKRLGSEVTILYRRGRVELKARAEEIVHAEEEGVVFRFLAAPVALHGDERGFVREIECVEMTLGEPDDSGRRRPVVKEGSNFRIPAETVVAAIGQGPNPTLQRETPALVTSRGKIVIDTHAKTSMDGVYAGGDVVRGGSTVILAMEDGRKAATAIDQALRDKFPENFTREAPAIPDQQPAEQEQFTIVARRQISTDIVLFEVRAPQIQRHWKPGQFVILRPRPDSERIPLTLVGDNPEQGTITLIVQAIGATTKRLAAMREGERLADVLGPLGQAGRIEKVGTVMCIGGGVGIAELLPVAKAFKDAGNHVIAMCGARTKDHMILDRELREAVDEVHWATDDGSHGFHGNVVEMMRHWRSGHPNSVGAAHVIGPIPMMKFASALTKEWGVPTVASLNPIMVDGTGMCGGCRVTVGGEVLFACVDGPEFNAHEVDFDELTARTRAYLEQEKQARERHACRVGLDA
jgi:glutamate synthase (NADPH/NADH) small chain